jgi:hypothetical protein
MARHRNKNWKLSGIEEASGSHSVETWDVQIAVLMDIRDELQAIKAVLQCPNTQAIPSLLRQLVRQTKPKRKAKPKPALRVVRRA